MTFEKPLLVSAIDTPYFILASKLDIATMKLWTIQNRATAKDYIDLVYILREISLSDLFAHFEERFGNVVHRSVLLKSLIYFDDISDE